MILNGVCVIWKGWIDLQRLDGMGCLEFDEERAQVGQLQALLSVVPLFIPFLPLSGDLFYPVLESLMFK